MDPDPDPIDDLEPVRQALDAGSNPAKWCRSDQTRNKNTDTDTVN